MKPKVDYFNKGMYRVGVDIPAGESVIWAGSDAYYVITKDSTGSIDSIINNDIFDNWEILTVVNGQYLEFREGNLFEFAKSPEVDIPSDRLPAGTYKVGIDIPPGEYKIDSKSDSAYFEALDNATGGIDSIVDNGIFAGIKYATVNAGQYLKLKDAELILRK